MADQRRLQYLWCDGFHSPCRHLLSEDPPKIVGKAWICDDRKQEEWGFTLFLPTAAAFIEDIDWRDVEFRRDRTCWMAVDRERKRIEIEPSAAVPGSLVIRSTVIEFGGVHECRSDRITHDPAVMGGKPCIRGLRVTVGTILGLLASGTSREPHPLEGHTRILSRKISTQPPRSYAAWRLEERRRTAEVDAMSVQLVVDMNLSVDWIDEFAKRRAEAVGSLVDRRRSGRRRLGDHGMGEVEGIRRFHA